MCCTLVGNSSSEPEADGDVDPMGMAEMGIAAIGQATDSFTDNGLKGVPPRRASKSPTERIADFEVKTFLEVPLTWAKALIKGVGLSTSEPASGLYDFIFFKEGISGSSGSSTSLSRVLAKASLTFLLPFSVANLLEGSPGLPLSVASLFGASLTGLLEASTVSFL